MSLVFLNYPRCGEDALPLLKRGPATTPQILSQMAIEAVDRRLLKRLSKEICRLQGGHSLMQAQAHIATAIGFSSAHEYYAWRSAAHAVSPTKEDLNTCVAGLRQTWLTIGAAIWGNPVHTEWLAEKLSKRLGCGIQPVTEALQRARVGRWSAGELSAGDNVVAEATRWAQPTVGTPYIWITPGADYLDYQEQLEGAARDIDEMYPDAFRRQWLARADHGHWLHLHGWIEMLECLHAGIVDAQDAGALVSAVGEILDLGREVPFAPVDIWGHHRELLQIVWRVAGLALAADNAKAAADLLRHARFAFSGFGPLMASSQGVRVMTILVALARRGPDGARDTLEKVTMAMRLAGAELHERELHEYGLWIEVAAGADPEAAIQHLLGIRLANREKLAANIKRLGNAASVEGPWRRSIPYRDEVPAGIDNLLNYLPAEVGPLITDPAMQDWASSVDRNRDLSPSIEEFLSSPEGARRGLYAAQPTVTDDMRRQFFAAHARAISDRAKDV